MKEPFDKKLAEKIRELFNTHEEIPHNKEWEKFSAAYFNKGSKKKAPIWVWWVSGIAASLLVGIWIGQNQLITLEPIEKKSFADNFAEQSRSYKLDEVGDIEALFEKPEPKKESIQSIIEITDSIELTNQLIDLISSDQITILQPTLPENEQITIQEEKIILPSQPTIALNHQTDTEKASEYIKNLLADDFETSTVTESKEPFKLGLLVSPQTVSNTNQPIGLSAGIISEISISKKLKLDMGVAFARQNINPNPNTGTLNMNMQDALDAASIQQLRAQSAGSNQFFSGNLISVNEELRFGQLEIPINLKYKMIERKKVDIFLVSGVSNMFYLNQERSSTLNFANFSSTSGIQRFTQTLSPESGDSQVSIGQLMNVAIGFEQQLNKGSYLYIEPFYKISVGNQTFADQQFSIGGINLRMNFQLKK